MTERQRMRNDTLTISIGPLRDEEAGTLAELAGTIWRRCYPGMISEAQIEYMLADRYRPILIRQTLARGDHWDVARAGREMLGFAHSFPLHGGGIKLDKLYVHPDFQRHGIGRLLLDRIIERGREQGRSQILLRVNRHNATALAAYRKYGFVVEREVVEDIGNGFVMDDYMMLLDL